MNRKSGEVVLAVLAAVAVFSAGMALITSKHNRLVATGDAGRVYLGVAVPVGPGVVSAVSNNKGEALLSAVAGIAAGFAVNGIGTGGSDKKGDSGAKVQVTGNGNTTIYNGADGTQSYNQNNSVGKDDQSDSVGQE